VTRLELVPTTANTVYGELSILAATTQIVCVNVKRQGL